MFLTQQEIRDLTGRGRRDAQVRALRHMGIDHRTRADGSVVVLKSHVEKSLGGSPEKTVRVKQVPNWNAIP